MFVADALIVTVGTVASECTVTDAPASPGLPAASVNTPCATSATIWPVVVSAVHVIVYSAHDMSVAHPADGTVPAESAEPSQLVNVKPPNASSSPA